MRNYSTILLLSLAFNLQAQISFGTDKVRGNALMDFGPNVNGIVLPYNDITKNPVPGTMKVNTETFQIQLFNGDDWFSFTDNVVSSENLENINIQKNNSPENESKQGIVIGNETEENTEGVLIFNSKDQPIILPQISFPHLNVVDPPVGMMCYDPVNNSVAFFNGIDWYYYN